MSFYSSTISSDFSVRVKTVLLLKANSNISSLSKINSGSVKTIPHTFYNLCSAGKYSLHTCHFSLKKINQLHQGDSFSSSLHWLSPWLNSLYNFLVVQLEAREITVHLNKLVFACTSFFSFFCLVS